MLPIDFDSIEIEERDTVPPVYILTHGRPDFCFKNTYSSLVRHGFTGQVVYVVDDEDETIEEYKKLPGQVELFSKRNLMKEKNFDTFLPHTDELYKAVLYARYASFEIAKRRGDRYFCVMDDDYKWFEVKMHIGQKTLNLYYPSNIDRLMNLTFDLLKSTNASVVAWSQNGDLLSSRMTYANLRKAMNVFFFDTEKAYDFFGAFNEDVNSYVSSGRSGKLILTVPFILAKQHFTQSVSGGMSDFYEKFGTYVKSFFSVIASPSSVIINRIGETEDTYRIHHNVKWENCAPRILSPDWEQRMKEKGYTGTRAKLNRKHVQTKVNKFIS